MCVRACVRVCVRECVRACVRVCVRECVRARRTVRLATSHVRAWRTLHSECVVGFLDDRKLQHGCANHNNNMASTKLHTIGHDAELDRHIARGNETESPLSHPVLIESARTEALCSRTEVRVPTGDGLRAAGCARVNLVLNAVKMENCVCLLYTSPSPRD